MSDQGMYQKGINSDSTGVAGTLIATGTIGGGGTYAVDVAGAITLTLPRAEEVGAGVTITLFGSDADIGGVVTIAPDATAPANTISGVTTMTTAVNTSQSYISDGAGVWVAFPYAV